MTAARTRPVVVGIDGSSAALAATRWAAAEAQRRGTRLRVVFANVFALVYIPDLPTVPLPESSARAMERQGEQWLRRAHEEATAVAPDLEVVTYSHKAGALATLVEESRRAQLAVVGSSGLGAFTGLFVGSVAVGLCAQGHCPVAVVRPLPTDDPGAPVVVGVDDAPSTERVLEIAFEEAWMRGVALEAVHAWHLIGTTGAWRSFHRSGQGAAVQDEEERVLAETIAVWSEKYPAVEVRRIVVQDKPARALLDRAQHAQLVVVGSRGRGPATGLLLGSTSQQLVHRAPCPLIVAR
ncbi:universal stress protein [Saccharopolyspora hordei]|uniref:Nucleotide-binding universal stress UspA family protein n=1 Tax=Saccharopolyspora hordei TaxID=1838 RepID=A0A853AHG1_9PSEU|nr:nucleotide-binding universal stress UspA family protein [Saccharopolyspora hordei]